MKIKISNLLIILTIAYMMAIGIHTIVKLVNNAHKIIQNKEIPNKKHSDITQLNKFNNLKLFGEGVLIIINTDNYAIEKNNNAQHYLRNDTLFIQLNDQDATFRLFVKDLKSIDANDYVNIIYSVPDSNNFDLNLNDHSLLILQCKNNDFINAKVNHYAKLQIIYGKIKTLKLLLKDKATAKIFALVDTLKGQSDKKTSIETLNPNNLLINSHGKLRILSDYKPSLNIKL